MEQTDINLDQLVAEQQDLQNKQQNSLQTTRGLAIEQSEVIQRLMDNSHIPEKLIKELWALFGSSSKLTFLNEEDVRICMLRWELLRLTIIESLPKEDYKEELESTLNMVGTEFFFNIKRSMGSRMNERELLSANTQANFAERNIGAEQKGMGFFSRLKNLINV